MHYFLEFLPLFFIVGVFGFFMLSIRNFVTAIVVITIMAIAVKYFGLVGIVIVIAVVLWPIISTKKKEKTIA